MQILCYFPPFIIKFIFWLVKIWKMSIFRYQLNEEIGRCIAKYGDNSPKTRIAMDRWYKTYEKKRKEKLHRRIVKLAWKTGRTVDDIEKEIS